MAGSALTSCLQERCPRGFLDVETVHEVRTWISWSKGTSCGIFLCSTSPERLSLPPSDQSHYSWTSQQRF